MDVSTVTVNEVRDVPALLSANITKMHHQQTMSQGIRTWSFAFIGFLIGSNLIWNQSITASLSSFVLSELILLVILIREIEWQRMFWRYRDRARACEYYSVGIICKNDFVREYLGASNRSRKTLLWNAFSLKRLITISTDFIEVYFMIVVAVMFVGRLLKPMVPVIFSLGGV